MEQKKQKRLKKYSRENPENLPNREITEKSINIINVIERYKFIPTSLLVRLVVGNMTNTATHLQNLYHQGLINRFTFPSVGFPSEFIYYLDDQRAAALLINNGRDRDTIDFDILKRNREAGYYQITKAKHAGELQGRLLFLSHELMISRFHFLLEKACEKSDGKVKLVGFFQGSQICNNTIAPKVSIDSKGNMKELDETEKLPHRPDALFALQFPDREGEKTDYYFYEADRKTTSTTKFNKKLRGHFYYIVKNKQQIEDYGIKRIKAVLIESIESHWADHLRISARNPIVSGQKPSPLFYFTTSEIFEQKIKVKIKGRERQIAKFLEEPELIFKKIWATPLDDNENPNFKALTD